MEDMPMWMKTSHLLGTLAAAMTLMVAAPAHAQSVKDIFEKYNLLGVFSWDCGKPAASTRRAVMTP
jgi:hypothetical protein